MEISLTLTLQHKHLDTNRCGLGYPPNPTLLPNPSDTGYPMKRTTAATALIVGMWTPLPSQADGYRSHVRKGGPLLS